MTYTDTQTAPAPSTEDHPMTETAPETAPEPAPALFTIPGAVLNAAALFAAKQDVRHYLNGVHFVTPADKAFTLRLEASDGCTAIRIDLDGWHGPALDQILPLPKLKAKADYAFCPAPPRTKPAAAATFATATEMHSCDPIDGTFPDLGRLIPQPSDDPRPPQYLDARYLERAGKAVQLISTATGNGGALHTRIQFGAHMDTALITCPALPHVQILMMPMRL